MEKKSSNKRLIEIEFNVQNENVSMQSRNKMNNTVKTPMKAMDAELVRDIQDAYPKSYEYTDANGDTKYRKFKLPDAEPELEDVIPYYSKETMNDDLMEIDREFNDAVNNIGVLKGELNQLIEEERLFNEHLNDPNTRMTTKTSMGILLGIKQEQDRVRNLIKDEENTIRNIQLNKRQSEDTYAEDNKRVNKLKKDNFDKVENYKSMLNDLNKGAFNTEIQPDETNEEYMTRLQENAQIEAPENEIDDAKLLCNKEFKDKIKEFIRNNGIIEQVCNSLTVNEKMILLKFWTIIKKKYLDLYGANNSKVNADDILTFLTHFLVNDPSKMNIDNNKVFSNKVEPENEIHTIKNVQITHDRANNCLILENPPSSKNRPLFLKVLNIAEKLNAKTEYILLYSFLGVKNSYTQWIDYDLPYTTPFKKAEASNITIMKECGIDKALFTSIFNNNSPLKICTELINKYHIHPLFLNEVKSEQFPLSQKTNAQKTTIYGYGLKPNENIHEYVHFGKLLLKQKSLYYKNILSVKQSNKLSIQGFQNVKVSDSFVKIIMNMLENINPTAQDIERLSTNERHLYDRLIVSSGLHKDLGVFHKGDNTIEEMKNRLKLIEGEIEIGNNSPLLVKEIHKIIYTLRDMRSITALQAKQYLSQF